MGGSRGGGTVVNLKGGKGGRGGLLGGLLLGKLIMGGGKGGRLFWKENYLSGIDRESTKTGKEEEKHEPGGGKLKRHCERGKKNNSL